MNVDNTTCNGVQRPKDSAYNINRKIFVGNVSYRIRSYQLTRFFKKFGPVEHCYIVKDHLKGWSRGIAFITFKDEVSMKRSLEATEEELILDDRLMRVKPAELSNKTTFWQGSSLNEDEELWDATCNSQGQSDCKIESHDEIDQSEMVSGTHINELFDDVLIHIFSMLTFKERVAIERVCQRWRRVVQDTWISLKSLSFHNFFKTFGGLTDKNLNSSLQRCGPYLESLDLSSSPGMLTDFSMDVVGNYCPGLRELDVSNVKITDISLKNLVAKCTRLRKVKLSRCIHITENKGVKPLLKGSPELEHIDLSQNLQVTGESFKIARPSLKSVILSKSVKVTDKCIYSLTKNCPGLEELNLAECRGITWEGLKHIAENFKALKSLNISSTSLSDPFKAFTGEIQLKSLEEADFSHNVEFCDRCLTAVSKNCPNLRNLDVSGCIQITEEGMGSLVCLQYLHTLGASFLPRNSKIEDALVKIAEGGNLRKLITRASPCLTNQGVMQIIASSPQLEHLDLSECFNITNQIFEAFKANIVDENKTVELYLGGTSVDWIGEDIDWVSGFSHLKVFMNSLGLYRDLIMQDVDDDSEEEYAPHRPISDYVPDGPIENYDDWEEDFDEFDDFLENDDPLAAERWDMS